jgi:catechol 2,3-dioxygenase-like lactoylglutathione lyase family enzyme
MFSHITLGTNNIERAAKFYDAVLAPLGLGQSVVEPVGGPVSRCWIASDHLLPRFYIYEPFDRAEASVGNGTMVAFGATSNTAVDNAHEAGLLAGGVDAGEPGPRPHYGDEYYGAYLHDPDENKIHVVHRGDSR